MKWPLLAALAPDDAGRVLAGTIRRTWSKGDAVFHEGDEGASLYLIDEGHVAVQTTTYEGETAALRVLGPGDFFGELALVSPGPRNATIVALDAVVTLRLRRDEFDRLRAAHPGIDGLLVEAMVTEVRRLSNQVRDAYYLPVPDRVVRRLAELLELYQLAGSDQAAAVVLPFTQEELAQLVGTARPTANKVLQALQSDGVLAIGRGKLVVHDPAELRWRAESL